MSINQSYAVFGLGLYGTALAKELVRSGAEVLGVDIDESIVNSAIADIPFCKCADVTDAEVIRQLGIANIDVVVITMATDLEASVLATMLCKEIGVKKVIVKCADEISRRILSKVGADQVVIPENEAGTRMAKNLLSDGFVDILEVSRDVSMVEMDVRPEWVGKNLLELDLRKKYGINVVAIIDDKTVITNIDPSRPFTQSMKLIVIANVSKISKLK
ncbi:MAG: TrkA family potassium uptake protein [Firmicutes bacterium]|nr:TrkA family potassium uptake protein [Bacillota bacterium]